MLALLLAAPGAGAATFGEGTTSVKLSPAFVKFLKQAKVKATASGGTAKTFNFNISDGDASLQQNSVGSLDHSQTFISLKKGTRKLDLNSIKVALAGTRGSLTGSPTGKRPLAILALATAGKTGPDAEFTRLRGTGIPAKLTPAAAKALNAALKLSGKKAFKRNQPVGTVTINAIRQLRIDAGGSTTTRLSKEYVDPLTACGVTQTPTRGALYTAPDPANPEDRGSLTLPVTRGELNATNLFGTVATEGGVQLSKEGKPSQEVYDFQFIRSTTKQELVAAASALSGGTLTIADLQGGTFTKQLDASGGTVSFSDVVIAFNTAAAGVLSQNFDCNIPPGTPLGTVSGTATVK